MIILNNKPALMIHRVTEKLFDLPLEDYTLTFDDGLLDHYHILDILLDKQVSGTFFIPCEAVVERRM